MLLVGTSSAPGMWIDDEHFARAAIGEQVAVGRAIVIEELSEEHRCSPCRRRVRGACQISRWLEIGANLERMPATWWPLKRVEARVETEAFALYGYGTKSNGSRRAGSRVTSKWRRPISMPSPSRSITSLPTTK